MDAIFSTIPKRGTDLPGLVTALKERFGSIETVDETPEAVVRARLDELHELGLVHRET